jgi:hypothetical protein
MPESFTPLAPATAGARETSFTPMNLQSVARGGKPGAILSGAKLDGEGCSQPVVTLQRNGDVVSAIRIQCGCGQVFDLACVY